MLQLQQNVHKEAALERQKRKAERVEDRKLISTVTEDNRKHQGDLLKLWSNVTVEERREAQAPILTCDSFGQTERIAAEE